MKGYGIRICVLCLWGVRVGVAKAALVHQHDLSRASI